MTSHLLEFRQSKGVTQKWLAEELGIHQETLKNYERGITQPPQSFYYHLAHIFRLNESEIQAIIPQNASF